MPVLWLMVSKASTTKSTGTMLMRPPSSPMVGIQGGSNWRISEFMRIDNLADKQYIGSVIVNDGNLRFFEPSPGRSVMLGVQASLSF